MKNYTLFVTMFLGCFFAFSQETFKNSPTEPPQLSATIMDKLAEDACLCVGKLDLSGQSQSQIEFNLGACILQGLNKQKTEIEKELGGFSVISLMTEELGELIGIQMLNHCPNFFLNFVEEDDVNTEDASIPLVELGKIKSIEKKQFNFVNLEMHDGSLLKFLWLWDFEGSEILEKNQFQDKWINIWYSTIELYDPEIKKYVPYRVIEAVSFG